MSEKSNELTLKIKEHVELLARSTNEAAISETMQAYLQCMSKFHQYSFGNTLLIRWTNPQATHVAGYKRWQKLGRQVRKGEHGIPILAPVVIRKTDPETDETRSVLVGFKIAHIFDISQTEGEPLPEQPNWVSTDKKAELENRLIAFAQAQGIKVEVAELEGAAQGMSSGKHITVVPGAGTKTLIHEIAHELLHQGQERFYMTRQEKEVEAEATAYVVGQHFGLADLASPNYLALWRSDANLILARLERIAGAARTIIKAVEAVPDNEMDGGE